MDSSSDLSSDNSSNNSSSVSSDSLASVDSSADDDSSSDGLDSLGENDLLGWLFEDLSLDLSDSQDTSVSVSVDEFSTTLDDLVLEDSLSDDSSLLSFDSLQLFLEVSDLSIALGDNSSGWSLDNSLSDDSLSDDSASSGSSRVSSSVSSIRDLEGS